LRVELAAIPRIRIRSIIPLIHIQGLKGKEIHMLISSPYLYIHLKQLYTHTHYIAAAHYNMGVGYFQLGDYQSSINAFQESLKLSPHHADVHTNIATAHIKLNSNLEEALRHLQAAANIAPQDAEIQV
jgi:tetratricopeptide (TPR) repeat protein